MRRGGIEIAPHPIGALRGGFDADGPTFGLSLRIKGAGLDYAFRGSKILGPGHRFALNYVFGGDAEEPAPAKAPRVKKPVTEKPKIKKPKTKMSKAEKAAAKKAKADKAAAEKAAAKAAKARAKAENRTFA